MCREDIPLFTAKNFLMILEAWVPSAWSLYAPILQSQRVPLKTPGALGRPAVRLTAWQRDQRVP